VALFLVSQAGPAGAAVFDWSYTAASGVTASGTLDVTLFSPGVYSVTSISGNRDGVSITGLSTFAEDDERIYPGSSPLLDYQGLSYALNMASPNEFNVYYDPSNTDHYACRTSGAGYCEIGPGVAGTTGLGPPKDTITAVSGFSLVGPIGVPEPSTWTLLMLGFSGVVWAALRRAPRPASGTT
jgi:hypothetical protein